MANKPSEEEKFEFQWIEARQKAGLSSYDNDEESAGGKFWRKLKSNPFVPIGALATSAFLTMGLMSMKSGNQRRSQLMMRGRILAQGFTIFAIVAGISIKAAKDMKENE